MSININFILIDERTIATQQHIPACTKWDVQLIKLLLMME